MANPFKGLALTVALHCYPKRWRDRHGEEASQLARLLADDGVPLVSIAFSYLGGAFRERFGLLVGRRWRARVAAVAAVAAVVSTAMTMSLSSSPAGALGVVRVDITKKADAFIELKSAFRAHDFHIAVSQVRVPASQAGSILAVSVPRLPVTSRQIIGEIRGTCSDGSTGCVVGLVIPANFAGDATVFVGRG
jgi:hypothetical protein